VAIPIQIRRDFSSAWSSVNPVLMQGEMGIDMDVWKFKIGNGASSWNQLSFATAAIPSFSAGTLSGTRDNLVFSNSNGVSFGMNGSTITASVVVGGAGGAAISAGTNSQNTGTVVFSNSNNVSFGLLAGVLTASASLPGGAGDGYNILSAGSQLANTTGTVRFADGNGITFGMSNNSIITATVKTDYQSSNAAYLISQSNQAVSGANGSSTFQTISFANSNGISWSTGTQGLYATVKTDYQTAGAYLTTARASNDAIGLNSALTANGVSATINSSGLSLNFPAFLTTAAQSGHSHGNPTLALTNLSGTTASASNGLTISLSAALGGGAGDGWNPAQFTNSTANSTQALVWAGNSAGSGNVTIGLTGSTITMSAPSVGGAGIAAAGGGVTQTNGTVNFANSNNISFGLSNNGTMTASFSQTVQPVAFAASGSTSNFSTIGFSNGQGVSFSISGGSIVGSVKTDYQSSNANYLTSQSNQAISAGTQASSTFQTLSFANSNGVSWSTGTQGLYATVQTNYQSAGAYLTTARASNDAIGLNTAFTGNGALATINSSGFSLNIPAFLTTAALSQNTSNYAGLGFSGTNASGTMNTNGLQLSIAAPGGGAADGYNAAQFTNSTANSTQILLWAGNSNGSGNVTMGLTGSTITMSAPSGGGGGGVAISAGTVSQSTGTVVFSNSNGVSFGMNSGTFTVSVGAFGDTFSYWDPDKEPSSPSSYDDEFNGSSLDGKWTTVNWGSLVESDVNTTVKGSIYLSANNIASTLVCGLQAIPAGDFTIYTKCKLNQTGPGNAGLGIVLSSTNTTGSGTQTVGYIGQWTTRTSGGSVITFTSFNTYGTEQIGTYIEYEYIRVRRSGTNYYWGFSIDGKTWNEFAYNPATTPAYFGFFTSQGLAYPSKVSFEFFRYFPSATATLGGTRTIGNAISNALVGVSAGTQSVSYGNLVFSNSNNITFGLSSGTNSSQTITASFGGGGGVAISAGTVSQSSGTVVFSNSNGVSFGMNAGTVTVSMGNLGEVFSYWDSDKKPVSPSAYDDEFDGSDALAGIWTGVNMTEDAYFAWDVNVSRPSAFHCSMTLNGNTKYKSMLQAIPSGDFTVQTVVSYTGIAYQGGIFISLTDGTTDATGTQAHFGFATITTPGIAAWKSTGFSGYGGTLFQGFLVDLNKVFLRIRRSGTTYYFGWSTTGTEWFEQVVTLGFTPTYFGISMVKPSSDYIEVSAEYFRYSSSATATFGGVRTVGNIASAFIQGVSAGTQSVSYGNIIFSNSNNITFGLSSGTNSSQTITASFGGGGGGGIAGAGGGVTQTSGTINFANSNNISFGLSNNGTMTASFSQTVQPVAFAASGSTSNFSTIGFSNGQGVSFSISGGSIVGSVKTDYQSSNANYLTSQSNLAISAGTQASSTFQTLSFANSNGVSWSTGTQGLYATVATNYQSQGAYLTTARASNDAIGLNSALTANGVSATMNSSGLSLNFPAFLTTAASSNHSHGNPSLALTNLAGTTASNSAGLTLSLSATAQSVQPVAYAAGGTTNNFSTVAFANSNGVSWSTGTQGLFATVATNYQSAGAYLTTARASNDALGLNSALTANGVSATMNSSGVSLNFPAFLTTAAQSNHSHGNPTLALTNLTGTTASDSNGLTLSLSGNAAGGGGGTASIGVWNNTTILAGNSTVTFDPGFVFYGAGGISVGIGSIGTGVSPTGIIISGPSAGVASSYNYPVVLNASVNTSQSLYWYGSSGATGNAGIVYSASTMFINAPFNQANFTNSTANSSQTIVWAGNSNGSGNITMGLTGSTVTASGPSAVVYTALTYQNRQLGASTTINSAGGQNSLWLAPARIQVPISASTILAAMISYSGTITSAASAQLGHTIRMGIWSQHTDPTSTTQFGLYWSGNISLTCWNSGTSQYSYAISLAGGQTTGSSAGSNLGTASVMGMRGMFIPIGSTMSSGLYIMGLLNSTSSAGYSAAMSRVALLMDNPVSLGMGTIGQATNASLGYNDGGTYGTTTGALPSTVAISQIIPVNNVMPFFKIGAI
jgi:hypothetical protein